jgi:hypothetical protein
VGKTLIVSLVLPAGATSIKDGAVPSGLYPSASDATFKDFTALKSVSGEGVKIIGKHAFAFCDNLSSVNFPAATTIDEIAFRLCTSLIEVNFPAATTIGKLAFWQCTNLTTANFLGEPTEGQEASIGASAFYVCTSLETVTFTAAKTIGGNAFYHCTSLTTANFPAAETINNGVFDGCVSLSSVDLRSAKTLSHSVFLSTGGTALTIRLGSPAPTLGFGIFFVGSDYVPSPKTVTVEVPPGATGYGNTIPQTYDSSDNTTLSWGNGFRGGGWTSAGAFVYDDVNYHCDITLHIKYIEAPEEPAE